MKPNMESVIPWPAGHPFHGMSQAEVALRAIVRQMRGEKIIIVRDEHGAVKMHVEGWASGVEGAAAQLAVLKFCQALVAERIQEFTSVALMEGVEQVEGLAPVDGPPADAAAKRKGKDL